MSGRGGPPVNWQPLVLGTLLGVGVLCVWRGLRILADRRRDDPARRGGFWWLNGGLALIAASVMVFTLSVRG